MYPHLMGKGRPKNLFFGRVKKVKLNIKRQILKTGLTGNYTMAIQKKKNFSFIKKRNIIFKQRCTNFFVMFVMFVMFVVINSVLK